MSYESARSYGSGGGFVSRRSFSQKPVEIGKEYDVQITETSRRGDGIARIQGFVIFVKGGRSGQNVKVKIT
jgi:predicted RNA-binding protein with TRAM domain